MSWNDRFIRGLEQIVEQLGAVPFGGTMDWNSRVIRLLEQIRDASGGGAAAGIQEHGFGSVIPVPSQGTLWMSYAGVPTSAAPLVIGTACKTRTATLAISEADANDYAALVYADGVLIETIDIPSGDTSVEETLSAAALAAGTRVTVVLSRTSGSGASTFYTAVLVLELEET